MFACKQLPIVFFYLKGLSEPAGLKGPEWGGGHCKKSTTARNLVALCLEEKPVFLLVPVTENFPSGIKQRLFV